MKNFFYTVMYVFPIIIIIVTWYVASH